MLLSRDGRDFGGIALSDNEVTLILKLLIAKNIAPMAHRYSVAVAVPQVLSFLIFFLQLTATMMDNDRFSGEKRLEFRVEIIFNLEFEEANNIITTPHPEQG